MYLTYRTPGGEYSPLYRDMGSQTHLLIAGCTGSGKSVVINGIMHSLLLHSPVINRFILIDVKRVELSDYRALPHTIAYADSVPGAIDALKQALSLIDCRYADMQRRREKLYSGCHVYIVIDELADLMTTAKRDVTPLLQRIAQVGRAARVHIIAATQCPITSVIPTQIKVNFDAVLGLRTRSAQDSRNILGCNGCEALPKYGNGYYMTSDGIQLYSLPMIAQSEIDRIVKHWTTTKPKRHLFRH